MAFELFTFFERIPKVPYLFSVEFFSWTTKGATPLPTEYTVQSIKLPTMEAADNDLHFYLGDGMISVPLWNPASRVIDITFEETDDMAISKYLTEISVFQYSGRSHRIGIKINDLQTDAEQSARYFVCRLKSFEPIRFSNGGSANTATITASFIVDGETTYEGMQLVINNDANISYNRGFSAKLTDKETGETYSINNGQVTVPEKSGVSLKDNTGWKWNVKVRHNKPSKDGTHDFVLTDEEKQKLIKRIHTAWKLTRNFSKDEETVIENVIQENMKLLADAENKLYTALENHNLNAAKNGKMQINLNFNIDDEGNRYYSEVNSVNHAVAGPGSQNASHIVGAKFDANFLIGVDGDTDQDKRSLDRWLEYKQTIETIAEANGLVVNWEMQVNKDNSISLWADMALIKFKSLKYDKNNKVTSFEVTNDKSWIRKSDINLAVQYTETDEKGNQVNKTRPVNKNEIMKLIEKR